MLNIFGHSTNIIIHGFIQTVNLPIHYIVGKAHSNETLLCSGVDILEHIKRNNLNVIRSIECDYNTYSITQYNEVSYDIYEKSLLFDKTPLHKMSVLMGSLSMERKNTIEKIDCDLLFPITQIPEKSMETYIKNMCVMFSSKILLHKYNCDYFNSLYNRINQINEVFKP